MTIRPGECIAISSTSRKDVSALMRAMAGLDDLAGGAVMVNGKPLDSYGPVDHNRILTYLSADNRLFDGTIQDNVTRFGEVTPEAAYEIARMLGIDTRFDELPGGMQTPVGDSAGGIVPPGLERQIALLRGLSHRPRMILFDHGDQGWTATVMPASSASLARCAARPPSSSPARTPILPRWPIGPSFWGPTGCACDPIVPVSFPIARWCSDAENHSFHPGRPPWPPCWTGRAMVTRTPPSSTCWR
jgi:hypothetical protein